MELTYEMILKAKEELDKLKPLGKLFISKASIKNNFSDYENLIKELEKVEHIILVD